MNQSGQRWFGVGRSLLSDPAEAGAAAARDAVRDRRPTLLVVVFASLPYATQAEAAHAAAGGDVPMIGCSTAGEFTPDGRAETVVVLAFGGPGFQTSVRAVPEGSCDLREAGMQAAGCLDDVDSEYRTVLLLGDGRSSDQQEMVRGAYAVAGAGVPLVGACAADGLTQTSTRHFFSTGTGVQVLTNGVLSAALGSDAPLGIGMAHGWRKTGEPMVVTRSHQGKIFELGTTLNLQTVAVGVEQPAQLTALRDLPCALAQGFLFAEPMPAADIPAFAARLVFDAAN